MSTNSIAQGEQAAILWGRLFSEYGAKIHFAHRTFAWTSEARGKANVHVVIVGFSDFERTPKVIVDYDGGGEPAFSTVQNIGPYLFSGPDEIVPNRKNPICNVPGMVWGSQPRDGGNLIFTPEEREQFLTEEPAAEKWIRPYLGAVEFLNGGMRYCLWLVDAAPSEIKAMPKVMERIEGVRKMRLASKAASTRRFGQTPAIFAQIAQPNSDYLFVPIVSSERRPYIPVGFMHPDTIASNLALMVPNAQMFHFGVVSSEMHMAWVRQFCGRLKSDFRYSKDIVYNNYPWPESPTDAQKAAVERAAQGVLDARAEFPDQTLADLYDPLAMPKPLRDAHRALDRAVDRCYRKNPFDSERARVEFLFALYQKLTAPLTTPEKGRKRRGK